jgi:hypothetical protein
MATPLHALIAASPHVGRSIEGVLAGAPNKTAERRLQFMFTELHRQMRVLDASRIRTEFLATDEWAGLVRKAVARAVQTRDCDRLSAIARALAGAATGTGPLLTCTQDPAQDDIMSVLGAFF